MVSFGRFHVAAPYAEHVCVRLLNIFRFRFECFGIREAFLCVDLFHSSVLCSRIWDPRNLNLMLHGAVLCQKQPHIGTVRELRKYKKN
jgi:hypothetical protein